MCWMKRSEHEMCIRDSIRKVLSGEDERENADDFLNDCVKQIRLGRLERQRRSALAACSAEQDAEKKHILLQKIDELGKKIHKLKTSF